jgi:NAD(P)-dependent dehydrogenase (short-subunit alcohol dehydrogenase family)
LVIRSSYRSDPGKGERKVFVITGATSGIGQVAAETLAAMGGRIVQIARDPARGEAAMARLQAISPDVRHSIHYADLSRLGEMKRVGREIAQAEPRIDILINNAGAMFGFRQLTEDGIERTFALNHLAYFVLTDALRERLLASAPARVINTSSDAHRAGTLDFDDLQSERAYRSGLWEWARFGGAGYRVYARSKLCNILFTRELARQLAGTGVTANCFHPGFVATRFGDQAGGLLSLGKSQLMSISATWSVLHSHEAHRVKAPVTLALLEPELHVAASAVVVECGSDAAS